MLVRAVNNLTLLYYKASRFVISRHLHDFNNAYKKNDYISKLLENKNTEIIIYDRLKPLVKRVEINKRSLLELLSISVDDYADIVTEDDIRVYVGRNEKGRHTVAICTQRASGGSDDLATKLSTGAGTESLWLRNPYDYTRLQNPTLWMKVRGLLAWHLSNLYCGHCGSRTRAVESGHKRVCARDDCGGLSKASKDDWSNYPRIDPSVMILPTTQADPTNQRPACLLARKDRFPARFISCLSGFINPGETAEGAATRELQEEAGLTSLKLQYHSSDYWPFQSSLLLGFSVEVPANTDFTLDTTELSFGAWFNADSVDLLLRNRHKDYFIPTRLSVSYRMMADWFELNRNK